MPDQFDLDRFVQAQDRVMEQVRRELSEGRKQTHWWWFVFPHLGGLGHSATARLYAITSLDLLSHPHVKHASGIEELATAIYSALRYTRMRIPTVSVLGYRLGRS